MGIVARGVWDSGRLSSGRLLVDPTIESDGPRGNVRLGQSRPQTASSQGRGESRCIAALMKLRRVVLGTRVMMVLPSPQIRRQSRQARFRKQDSACVREEEQS